MVRPRKHTDEEILEVARAVFLEHGPGASLQTVAALVGLSQPALSNRFGSKEALLLRALAPDERLPWVERLFAGPDARPIPEQLTEICRGALAFFAVAIPAMMTLRASGLDLAALQGDAELPPLRARRAVVSFFQRARAEGRVRDADPEAMATILIGSLEAGALMAHVLGQMPDEPERARQAAALVDLLWRGVQPAEPAPEAAS